MNKALRENVQLLATDSLETIRGAILGKAEMNDKVKEAIRMVALGVKVEHMTQVLEQSNRSFALRLIPYLPKTLDRDEYIKITNPQIAPLMLARPKKP
jgi:hypothetical protein